MASLELALWNPALLILLRVDAWWSSLLPRDCDGQEEDGEKVVLHHGQAGGWTDFTESSCI